MANNLADVLRISELEDQLRDSHRKTESLQSELIYLRSHTERQIADLEADLRHTRDARDSHRKDLVQTREQLDRALKDLGEMKEAKRLRTEARVDVPGGVLGAVILDRVADEAGGGVRAEDGLAASQSPDAVTSVSQEQHGCQDMSPIVEEEKVASDSKMKVPYPEPENVLNENGPAKKLESSPSLEHGATLPTSGKNVKVKKASVSPSVKPLAFLGSTKTDEIKQTALADSATQQAREPTELVSDPPHINDVIDISGESQTESATGSASKSHSLGKRKRKAPVRYGAEADDDNFMYVENDPSSDLSELSDDFSERDEDSDEEYSATASVRASKGKGRTRSSNPSPRKAPNLPRSTTTSSIAAGASAIATSREFPLDNDNINLPVFSVPYLTNRTPTPISRQFLASHYHCSNVGLVVPLNPVHNPSPSFTTTKPLQMLHPTHEQNPHLPTEFGKPGSILSNRPELEPENYKGDRNKGGVPVYRLWVKFRGGEGKKVERTCYFGEYEVKNEGPLSGAEFQALDRNVRKAWTSFLHGAKPYCYASMVARIAFRSVGRAITTESVEKEAARRKGKNASVEVSKEEIERAMSAGEETLNVWSLKCVGYDEAFEEDMKTWWPVWEEEQRRKKEGGSSAKRKK